MEPVLIGLAGKAGTGKDTVCNILVEKCGFVKVSFAEPLKFIVSKLTGWPYEVLIGDRPQSRALRETLPPYEMGDKMYNYRQMLQYVGTDLIRDHMGKETWVKIARREIADLMQKGFSVCVSDVRFMNEIKTIEDLGGLMYCVWRTREDLIPDPLAHSSENEFLSEMSAEKHLDNTGTIAELQDRLIEKHAR